MSLSLLATSLSSESEAALEPTGVLREVIASAPVVSRLITSVARSALGATPSSSGHEAVSSRSPRGSDDPPSTMSPVGSFGAWSSSEFLGTLASSGQQICVPDVWMTKPSCRRRLHELTYRACGRSSALQAGRRYRHGPVSWWLPSAAALHRDNAGSDPLTL